MKNILLLLLTSSLLLAAACNTEDDMTPTTENTHDILRCKINGEDWAPKGGDLFSTQPYDLYYYSDTKGVELLAINNTENTSFNGALYMIGIVENINTKIPLIDNSSSLTHITNSLNPNDCKYYQDLDSTIFNYIQINQIDSLDYYLIGEFEYSAINECNDTIRVTDGYFDLNYKF